MNQENEIKAGDTVRLKSGGISMTVGYVHNDIATCYCYIQEKANFEVKELPTITLKIVD